MSKLTRTKRKAKLPHLFGFWIVFLDTVYKFPKIKLGILEPILEFEISGKKWCHRTVQDNYALTPAFQPNQICFWRPLRQISNFLPGGAPKSGGPFAFKAKIS